MSERFVCPDMALYALYMLLLCAVLRNRLLHCVVIAVCQWLNKDAVCLFVLLCLRFIHMYKQRRSYYNVPKVLGLLCVIN